MARDEIVVRRPRDLRAVAREWKRGSEGMPLFEAALVSDHAYGRGLLVPFVPMPMLNKMKVFFGESAAVDADSVEMKDAREFFYGSVHQKSLTVEAEERGDSRERVRLQRLQFASAFCVVELSRRSALEATIASLPRETYELVLYVDYEKYDETAMSVTTSESRLQPSRLERPAHGAPAPPVAAHLDMSAIALPQTGHLLKERGPTKIMQTATQYGMLLKRVDSDCVRYIQILGSTITGIQVCNRTTAEVQKRLSDLRATVCLGSQQFMNTLSMSMTDGYAASFRAERCLAAERDWQQLGLRCETHIISGLHTKLTTQ